MARAIFQANDNPSADQAQTLLSNKEPKEYVSTDHGFRVVFPGFPEIERDTRDMAAGYAVPYTFYTASINPDVDSRAVFVYDFSGATSNPADINLGGMLNGMVQTKDGGHLVSTAVASLGGIEGLEGYFRSAQDGELSDNYIVLVRVGAKLYVAMSVGIPRSEFEEFTGSFRFE